MIIALALLGGIGAVGLLALAATARTTTTLDRAGHLAGWSAVHGGLDPAANPLVARWLRLVYGLAAPLARIGAHPDLLSVAGVWVTAWVVPAAYAGGRWPLAAALAVVTAGVVDGLDGAVAVIAGRATAHGAVLDRVADRAGDLVLVAGLALLGAPWWLAVAAAVAVFGLELTRRRGVRRLGGAGGRITAGERPTRLILAGLGFLAGGIFDGSQDVVAGVAAAAILAVSALSWAQLAAGIRASR